MAADTIVPAASAVLENNTFRRAFTLGKTGLETSAYTSLVDGNALAETVGAEAAVTLDGNRYALGADGGFRLAGHAFWDEGSHPELVFTFTSDTLPGLSVELIYETPKSAPVIMKRVRVLNQSNATVRMDHIDLGCLVPRTSGKQCVLVETDYVRDGVTVNGERVYSPWIEAHNDYMTRLLSPEETEHRFGYPVEMDWSLAAGETFESFRVYEFIVDNAGIAARGLGFRQITRELFPWTRNRWLATSPPPARDVQEYYRAIDAAAEVGFEGIKLAHCWLDTVLTSPLFTNYNDYELRPELFPNGWEDVRKLTDYAHEKGLKISFYSIYVNSWRDPKKKDVRAITDHNWELVFAEDDNSSRWGYTFDPATGWGPFVNEKMEEAIVKGGFDQYHLDGPYYGDVSVNQGTECKAPGANQALAWERQKEFYQRMKELGIPGEAAQGFCAFANGMSRITTTGYNEGDFGEMSPDEQVVNLRQGMYDFTRAYRPEQASTFVCIYPWSPHADAPSLLPMEENMEVYEAYLASCFGYGFEGRIFQPLAYDGPRSKAAVERWLGFWKDHEAFFKQGYLHHVAPPNGKDLDAVMHALEDDGSRRALVVAFNPAGEELTRELPLPFDAVGWPGQGWSGKTEQGKAVDVSDGAVRVTVAPRSATWLELTLSVQG